jgi:hypothetical protein
MSTNPASKLSGLHDGRPSCLQAILQPLRHAGNQSSQQADMLARHLSGLTASNQTGKQS